MTARNDQDHPADPVREPIGPIANDPPPTVVPGRAVLQAPATADPQGTTVPLPREVPAQVVVHEHHLGEHHARVQMTDVRRRTVRKVVHALSAALGAVREHGRVEPVASANGPRGMVSEGLVGKATRKGVGNVPVEVVRVLGPDRADVIPNGRYVKAMEVWRGARNVAQGVPVETPRVTRGAVPSLTSNAPSEKVLSEANGAWAPEVNLHRRA